MELTSDLASYNYRYNRSLVEAGTRLCRSAPSLQDVKGEKVRRKLIEYADGWERRTSKNLVVGYSPVQGLGEMNADRLWGATMDQKTARTTSVTIDDLARAERRVSVLMGE